MTHRHLVLVLVTATLTAQAIPAQQNDAAQRIMLARASYYTPTADGLRAFRCDVHVNWKTMLERGGQQAVADNSPVLLHLNATKLSLLDNLNGAAVLTWTNDTQVPDGKEPAIAMVRNGMTQMFQGYFRSWNGFMNGSMVPRVDQSVMVRPEADGVELHMLSPGMDFTQHYDKNMLLTSVHAVSPRSDVTAYPTYADTPEGRLIMSVRSLIKQPPSAPPIETDMSETYQKVDGYLLPATLDYHLKNVTHFHFDLSGCVINPK